MHAAHEQQKRERVEEGEKKEDKFRDRGVYVCARAFACGCVRMCDGRLWRTLGGGAGPDLAERAVEVRDSVPRRDGRRVRLGRVAERAGPVAAAPHAETSVFCIMCLSSMHMQRHVCFD